MHFPPDYASGSLRGWHRTIYGPILNGCLILVLLGYVTVSPAELQKSAPQAVAQPQSAAPLHAGPIYTSAATAVKESSPSGPAYPTFDVVVPLDPQTTSATYNAGDWEETEAGRADTVTATTVRPFEKTGYGIAVILALDVSGSMRGRSMQTIRHSVAKFVDDAQPQDRVSVMTFADETRWDVPFTAQSSQVHKAIEGLAPRGHETHLYDAMLSALDRFDDTMPKRRVIIVMSDGHDEGSTHTLDQVIVEAKARHISIHTIGIAQSDLRYLKYLKSASEETGGTYASARSDEELDHLLSHGIAALQQTPVVTFKTMRDDAAPQTVSTTITWLPGKITALADLHTGPISKTDKTRKELIVGVILIGVVLIAILLFLMLRPRSRPLPPVSAAAPPVPLSPNSSPPLSASYKPAPIPEPFTALMGNTRPDGLLRGGSSAPAPLPEAPGPRSARHTRFAVEFHASPQKAFALFKALEGPLSGATIAIDLSPFTIGAAADNSLPIEGDPTLSGHHARISLEGSILFVDDLGSTNGTYLNSEKLVADRRALSPADKLRFGRSLFEIVPSSAQG